MSKNITGIKLEHNHEIKIGQYEVQMNETN